MKWLTEGWSEVVQMAWHVANLIDDSWSHLSDVHVDHQTVVSVDLVKLLRSQILCFDIVLDVNMLVGQDHVRVPVLISWGLKVVDLQVVVDLVLIVVEVEVALGGHLLVGLGCEATQLFLGKLVLEALKLDFVLDKLVDLGLNLGYLTVVA